MKKLPYEYENPLDVLLYKLSDYLCPFAKSLGLTPNWITTLSNIFCIITIILLIKSYYIFAILTFLISYFFDCMDGYMARKYKMFSKYGDMYDHVSDFIKFTLIYITLIYIDYKKFIFVLPIIIIALICSHIQVGCQELYYDKNESPTLDIYKKLCPVKNKDDKQSLLNAIQYTRYIGPCTFIIVICLIFLYYKFDKVKKYGKIK
jgi:amino acid transporter